MKYIFDRKLANFCQCLIFLFLSANSNAATWKIEYIYDSVAVFSAEQPQNPDSSNSITKAYRLEIHYYGNSIAGMNLSFSKVQYLNEFASEIKALKSRYR